ncbi:hypothetical protein ZHAS_00003891 [Anopheles sinensis]|uniref:Uncharacterized protein n=1 Tax=Anopheles sinensis TaxID=74873 RepID=A0A084VFI0_ANOSI|nr:hypothetical protein ZHAS_00003891 [Anopheles sinensis]
MVYQKRTQPPLRTDSSVDARSASFLDDGKAKPNSEFEYHPHALKCGVITWKCVLRRGTDQPKSGHSAGSACGQQPVSTEPGSAVGYAAKKPIMHRCCTRWSFTGNGLAGYTIWRPNGEHSPLGSWVRFLICSPVPPGPRGWWMTQ